MHHSYRLYRGRYLAHGGTRAVGGVFRDGDGLLLLLVLSNSNSASRQRSHSDSETHGERGYDNERRLRRVRIDKRTYSVENRDCRLTGENERKGKRRERGRGFI